jgi:hypothetical protein
MWIMVPRYQTFCSAETKCEHENDTQNEHKNITPPVFGAKSEAAGYETQAESAWKWSKSKSVSIEG